MYKILLYHHRSGFETDFPTEASRTLYDGTAPRNDLTILTGNGKNSITELPTFDFTILPNHPLYDEIVKFKTWITVYCNNNVRFHGRVMTDSGDFYGQKQVSCEGALGCLLDSVLDPIKAVNETPEARLRRLIAAHNAQMNPANDATAEPYKCFTVGIVNVDNANVSKKFDKVEGYSQTRSLIDSKLLNEFKGYLRVRYVDGINYLDWIKEFGETNAQPVKMAVNMLDRSMEESADGYYTVLLPVGNNNKTITGKYLKDDTAIARYGRIFKAQSFTSKDGKKNLLEEAQKEFAKRGSNMPLSAHIKAVDMYLLGQTGAAEILCGQKLTNVEDRTGALFTDLTVAEHNYDILNPANDEFVMENQEAIDKRHTESGNGTISSRAGRGSADLFAETKDLTRNYNNLTLEVRNNYLLHADSIKESSKTHEIITGIFDLMADETNVRTTDENVTTVKFKKHYPSRSYGSGDYVRENDKTYIFLQAFDPEHDVPEEDRTEYNNYPIRYLLEHEIIFETGYGESVDVKSIYGTRTYQDSQGATTVIQDVTGILVDKVRPTIIPFAENTQFHEGDYVNYNQKIYRCLFNHKGPFTLEHFGYVCEAEDQGNLWKYEPVYQRDEQGNFVYNVITGEKEYQIVDGNLEGIPVTNPIKSIQRRTQTEFYDVIGNVSTYQAQATDFSELANYSVGQVVKRNGKFYRFIQAHNAKPWDFDDVETLAESTVVNGQQMFTMTSVGGSTLFHNETEIDQIVGEVEVVQTKDLDGKVVGRNLYIKNGSGLRSRNEQGVEVGIFENGQLNAGLLVTSLNNNTSIIKAMQFKTTRQYEVGDLVQNGSTIYRCTVRHKGQWDDSHFTAVSGYIAKLSADVVDLGTYATVEKLDATIINVEYLTSSTAEHINVYADSLYADEIVLNEGGTVYADNFHGSADGYVQAGEILYGNTDLGDSVTGFGTATYPTGQDYDVSIPFYTVSTPAGSQDPAGSINFSIANTAKYRADVGIASSGSINTSSAWTNDGEGGGYYKPIRATAKNGSYADATVSLPTITVDGALNSVTATAELKAYGPAISGTAYAVSVAKNLYLKQLDNAVYLTNANATPVPSGTSQNTLAKLDVSGVYNSGWDDAAVSMGLGAASSETEYNSWTTGYTPVTVASGTGYRVYITKSDGQSVAGIKFLVPAQTAGGISSIAPSGVPEAAYNQMTNYEEKTISSQTGFYTVVAVPNSGSNKGIRFKIPPDTSSNVTIVDDDNAITPTVINSSETNKIKLTGATRTASGVNAEVTVTLSNGKRLRRTITGIANGFSRITSPTLYYWSSTQRDYVEYTEYRAYKFTG